MRAFRHARISNLFPINEFAFAGILAFCGRTGNLHFGEAIHGLVVVTGFSKTPLAINSLINMYSKCNRIEKARLQIVRHMSSAHSYQEQNQCNESDYKEFYQCLLQMNGFEGGNMALGKMTED